MRKTHLFFVILGPKERIESKTDIYGKVRQILSGAVLMFTAEPSGFVFQNKVMNIDAVKVKLQVRTSSLPHQSAVVFLSSENKANKK